MDTEAIIPKESDGLCHNSEVLSGESGAKLFVYSKIGTISILAKLRGKIDLYPVRFLDEDKIKTKSIASNFRFLFSQDRILT